MDDTAHRSGEQPNDAETSQQSPEAFIDSAQTQAWTESGYPIVAGKYLEKGTIKEIDPNEPTQAGPPALDIYWHNRYHGPEPGLFRGVACAGFVDVTEYIARLGIFLKFAKEKDICQIKALNSTLYSVNIIVATQESATNMMRLLLEYGLAPVPPP